MNQTNAENLAEQIAALLKNNGAGGGDGLRSAVESLNQRLDRLESRLSEEKVESQPAAHPSVQRFTSLGEIADVILDRLNNQKDCPYEPAGKPCDNCSMCSSRGF